MTAEETERNRWIYEQHVLSYRTQQDIADELGLVQSTVAEIIAREKAKRPQLSVDEYRQRTIAMLEHIHGKTMELAEMEGAPVTSGKDGLIVHDEDGSVVRDYSLRLAALKEARAAGDAIAKRLGLDAPARTQVEHSGNVRYEIGGLDADDLT